jgi:hypothetical protein
MALQKDRKLQEPVKLMIEKLNNLMIDVCTLEISDNKAALSRLKRDLKIVGADIDTFIKEQIEPIRKQIINERTK